MKKDNIVIGFDPASPEGDKTVVVNKGLSEFLNNEDNRKKAEEKAIQLCKIMTNGCYSSNERFENLSFTTTEIRQATNMSHSEIKQLVNLLSAFGFVEFGDKPYKINIHFNKDWQRSVAKDEVLSAIDIVKDKLTKYISVVKSDDKLTLAQKKAEINNLKIEINKILK